MASRPELLLLLMTLGSCGAMAGLATAPMLAEAKANKLRLDLRNLASASKLWFKFHQNFPTTEEGLEAMVREKIIEGLPFDTWGRPYRYESIGRTCRIFSLGADGQRGGIDEDEDVFIWLSVPPNSTSVAVSGPAAWPPPFRQPKGAPPPGKATGTGADYLPVGSTLKRFQPPGAPKLSG